MEKSTHKLTCDISQGLSEAREKELQAN